MEHLKLYIRQKCFPGEISLPSKIQRFRSVLCGGRGFLLGQKSSMSMICVVMRVAFIQQKLFTFLPRYEVYMREKQVAEIAKEFTFLFPKYRIDGPNWDIEGTFMEHDYEITQAGRPYRHHPEGMDDLGETATSWILQIRQTRSWHWLWF